MAREIIWTTHLRLGRQRASAGEAASAKEAQVGHRFLGKMRDCRGEKKPLSDNLNDDTFALVGVVPVPHALHPKDARASFEGLVRGSCTEQERKKKDHTRGLHFLLARLSRSDCHAKQ